MRITDEHIATYKRQGYAVVERFLDADEVRAAMHGFHALFAPSFEEFAAGKQPDYSQNLFPWDHDGLNHACVHPELVLGAERIIGTRDIRLADSDINVRYATQEIGKNFHIDFGNNTLGPTVPEDHSNITLALVLTDVDPGIAPTYMVPWGQPDSAGVPMCVPARGLAHHLFHHEHTPFREPVHRAQRIARHPVDHLGPLRPSVGRTLVHLQERRRSQGQGAPALHRPRHAARDGDDRLPAAWPSHVDARVPGGDGCALPWLRHQAISRGIHGPVRDSGGLSGRQRSRCDQP